MRLAVWHALTAKRASFYVIAFECNGWILSNQHHVWMRKCGRST